MRQKQAIIAVGWHRCSLPAVAADSAAVGRFYKEQSRVSRCAARNRRRYVLAEILSFYVVGVVLGRVGVLVQ